MPTGKWKRTEEQKARASEYNKKHGIRPPSSKGRILSKEAVDRIRTKTLAYWTIERREEARQRALNRKGKRSSNYIHYQRIEDEAERLQQMGYRVIPLTRVIPDIIAIKGSKVTAIEVDYSGTPQRNKYAKVPKTRYDAIVWLLRKFWGQKKGR